MGPFGGMRGELQSELRSTNAMDGREQRIKENVRLVIEQLGPVSGLDFGLNRHSIEWVEGFIERQRTRADFDRDCVDGLVNTLGSFLGECIATESGGSWQWSEAQQMM